MSKIVFELALSSSWKYVYDYKFYWAPYNDSVFSRVFSLLKISDLYHVKVTNGQAISANTHSEWVRALMCG